MPEEKINEMSEKALEIILGSELKALLGFEQAPALPVIRDLIKKAGNPPRALELMSQIAESMGLKRT